MHENSTSSYIERINKKRSNFAYQIDVFLNNIPDHVLPKLKCLPADKAEELLLGMVIFDYPDEKYVCYPVVKLFAIKKNKYFDNDCYRILYDTDRSKTYKDILDRCIAKRRNQ